MKCQFCSNTATVHLTKIVNKRKRELRLCDACARKKNLLPTSSGSPTIDLKALLGLLVSSLPSSTDEPSAATCPACGVRYAEFRAEGRLGCPADYDAFRSLLEPLLERIHRGLTHAGKVPRVFQAQQRAMELAELRRRMTEAVAAEHYEQAAVLRDLIRQKEAADESR